MCNCIKEVESMLKEKVKNKEKFKDVENITVEYPNVSFTPRENDIWESGYFLEFIAEGKYKTKSGITRTKKESLNVRFSYCPMCGQKV